MKPRTITALWASATVAAVAYMLHTPSTPTPSAPPAPAVVTRPAPPPAQTPALPDAVAAGRSASTLFCAAVQNVERSQCADDGDVIHLTFYRYPNRADEICQGMTNMARMNGLLLSRELKIYHYPSQVPAAACKFWWN